LFFLEKSRNPHPVFNTDEMTRGNQREMDRAKAAKKQAGQKKEREGSEGMSVQNIKLQYHSTL
jgi:hypothetical protein